MPNAQFELAAVDDPYGFASKKELSLFRRPLPTTNVNFLNSVMWDGRETFLDPASTDCLKGTTTCFAPLRFNLLHQSNAATEGHAQATTALMELQREAIVKFQLGLFTAQAYDDKAGRLYVHGGKGGPSTLAAQKTYFAINDTVAGDFLTGKGFTPNVMSLFDDWNLYMADPQHVDEERRDQKVATARRAIARGQALFNGRQFTISKVKGVNDDLGVPALQATCTTCHNTPQVGNHSIPFPVDIGLADAARRTPDMPLYTLRNTKTGEMVQTTDPGRALVTGQWKDIGRFKGPVLRALAARAPYFHNGSAANLEEVIVFYNDRFGIGLSKQEREDLEAFLRAL